MVSSDTPGASLTACGVALAAFTLTSHLASSKQIIAGMIFDSVKAGKL